MFQEINQFKQQLRQALQQETQHSPALTIAKNAQVYRCGEADQTIYFIERGQIKLLIRSPEKRECLLAIHTAGDLFGELCLAAADARLETATAMEETVLKPISCPQFFAHLRRDAPFMVSFVQYLAVRLADQQQVIASLTTVNSEQRLGQTLLRLARTLGQKTPHSLRLEVRITHEELSEMVGTTRPRISVFMQRFKNLGLLETNAAHLLTIKEKKLAAYLAQSA